MSENTNAKTEVKKDSLQRLSHVEVPEDEKRVPTGIPGLDQCLAPNDEEMGGIPLGTSILLSGMPGGGKSTMATQIICAEADCDTLYLHGEERASNVKKRTDRLSVNKSADPWLAPLRAAEDALSIIRDLSRENNLRRVVIDSVQTITLAGSRRYDHQYEASEMLIGQVCSNSGIALLVSHTHKTGKSHAGSQSLAHLVDIHLHVSVNSRRGERVLEVRKNRHGRAGFQVPINIGQNSLSVGVPAPITGNGLAPARSLLEQCRDKAIELLLSGEKLNFYDYDKAGVNGNMWRAGLEMAAKSLMRPQKTTTDSNGETVIVVPGYNVKSEKIKARMTFWIEGLPPKIPLSGNKIEVVESLPIELS